MTDFKTTHSTFSYPSQSTDSIIGTGLLASLHEIPQIAKLKASRCIVLFDETTATLFSGTILGSLEKLGTPITRIGIPAGEAGKRLETVKDVIAQCFRDGIDRRSVLFAVGGGTVTDVGGFIGSILMRGIRTVYIPTTLLAQVDAAIGGKTGINYWVTDNRMYKNMIGTIYQPACIISDIDTLATLPDREIISGVGEMVKYWVGWGKPSIEKLHEVRERKKGNPAALLESISLCQSIKREVVAKDPLDRLGLREQLNVGHTIGHALESAAQGRLTHGEAVAIGLTAASYLSVWKGMLPETTAAGIRTAITELGLPTNVKNVDREAILPSLKFDKKNGTFVLIRDIGKLETGISVEIPFIEQVLKEILL